MKENKLVIFAIVIDYHIRSLEKLQKLRDVSIWAYLWRTSGRTCGVPLGVPVAYLWAYLWRTSGLTCGAINTDMSAFMGLSPNKDLKNCLIRAESVFLALSMIHIMLQRH